MKTVSGSIVSSATISLSKADSVMNSFISLENGASQAISVYLKSTLSSFDDLLHFHGRLERGRKRAYLEREDNGNLTDVDGIVDGRVQILDLGEKQSFTEMGGGRRWRNVEMTDIEGKAGSFRKKRKHAGQN